MLKYVVLFLLGFSDTALASDELKIPVEGMFVGMSHTYFKSTCERNSGGYQESGNYAICGHTPKRTHWRVLAVICETRICGFALMRERSNLVSHEDFVLESLKYLTKWK